MSSWIKVSRKLLSSSIASRPDYLAVWIHLLLSASYKEGEILVGRQIVRLKPGELVFGRQKFAEKTGVSEGTIRSALAALESLQQITIKTSNKFSIISITNWSRYQSYEPADDQQLTSKEPADDHNKEGKEIKEYLLSSEPDDTKAIDYQAIAKAFREILPALPQPKDMTEARRKMIRSIVKRNPKYSKPEFFPEFFKYVSKSDFLMGRTERPWQGCCFDWLLKPANFQKIIEGNYHPEQKHA